MLLPPELSGLEVLLLMGLSLLTSGLTAALGAGGGLLMLSVMVQVLPVQVVIPVHGMVQLGSNVGRAVMARQAIDWQLSWRFLLGAAVGAAVGVLLLRQVDAWVLLISIGSFVLWSTWSPPSVRMIRIGRRGLPAAGAVLSLLALFVGAVGPPVLASLQRLARDRVALVATAATCISGIHLLKIGAFGLAGFQPGPWLLLAGLLIGSGLLGTWSGLRLLRRLPESTFRLALKWLLTLLALRMLWQGLAALPG